MLICADIPTTTSSTDTSSCPSRCSRRYQRSTLTVREAPSSCCGRTSGELWESPRYVPIYTPTLGREADRNRRVWDGNTTRSTSPSRTFCSSSESCLYALNNSIKLTPTQAPHQLPTSSALEVTAHDEDDGDDLHDARLLLDPVPLRISDRTATQATAASERYAFSDPLHNHRAQPELETQTTKKYQIQLFLYPNSPDSSAKNKHSLKRPQPSPNKTHAFSRLA